MKKTIFTLAITMLIAGTIITGCQSPAQKEEAAQAKVLDAKQELKEVVSNANAEAQKTANAEEWKTFRNETEVKIKDNEIRIADLKVKMKKQGKTLDALYEKKMDALEQKNKEMKAKMDAYEKSQSDWESFKREFNHDMDELGQSLKDFTIDNKK